MREGPAIFDVSVNHLGILLLLALVWLGIPAAILYGIIRLAVRHGRRDAGRRP